MNTGRYKTITRADAPLVEPGFINAWISFPADFSTMATPTLSVPAVIGEAYTISTSHAWTAGKEPIKLLVKQESIEMESESVGDIGGARQVFKPKLFLKGDGPVVEEICANLLNDEFILFVEESLDSGMYLQFGNADIRCETEKISGKSGTLISGGKGRELQVRSFNKFYYRGTMSTR